MGMTSKPLPAEKAPSSLWTVGHEDQHPELYRMCVVDTATMERIVPNSGPVPIDNDCFSGQVFLLIRTPDVDSPTTEVSPASPVAKSISKYMVGRQRRFEFQFQLKLKKVPTGPIFLGCEVENPLKMGRVAKGLTSVLLAMIRRINSGFHYSWGVDKKTTSQDIESGNYEKTHLSFPVEASMDRIVITKPGDTPPELGKELPETPESVKRRRKLGAGCIDWNTEDTYSMCLWSAYVDWIQWRCMNVVGVRPFPLGFVLGSQPIVLSVYEIKDCSNEHYKKKRPPHLRKSLNVYSRLEFSHYTKTVGALSERLGDHVTVPDPSSELRTSYLYTDDKETYETLSEDMSADLSAVKEDETCSSGSSVSSNPNSLTRGESS